MSVSPTAAASAKREGAEVEIVRQVSCTLMRRSTFRRLIAVLERGPSLGHQASLRLLVKDLPANGTAEIVLTYRIVTSAVCSLPGSVGAPGIEPGTSRV